MSKAKAIKAAAKVVKKTARRIQSRKQVSKDAFDKSKVKTGDVKVTKVSKSTTPKKTTTPKKDSSRSEAAKKAWKTRRANQAKRSGKKSPDPTLSAPVKKATKADVSVKKATPKTPKKTPTKTPRNAGGTSERAGIGGRRSTKDSLKSAASQQETRIVKSPTSSLAKNTPKPKKPKASKPTKPKRKGPSSTAKRNARRKKLLRARDEKKTFKKTNSWW